MKTYKTRQPSDSRAAAARIAETEASLREMLSEAVDISSVYTPKLLEETEKIHEVSDPFSGPVVVGA